MKKCSPTSYRLSRIFLSALAVLALAAPLHAATVSYNFSYGPEGVPASVHTIGNLPLFDPSMGTLTQVDLTLDSVTYAGTLDWENTSAQPTTVTLGIGATVKVTAQYGGLTLTAVPLQTGGGTVTAFDGTADYMGTSASSVVGGTGNDSDSDNLTGGAVAPYIGLGTFSVDGLSTVATMIITDGGGTYNANPMAGLTEGLVTVTYTFVPVPEPATLSLAVIAIGSVFGFRRIRRRA